MSLKIAHRNLAAVLVLIAAVAPSLQAEDTVEKSDPSTKKVSFYNQIRPIFQAHCLGCHQPAKSSGDYVMTDFAKLKSGGESESAAVTPGDPAKSNLIELITPVDGAAEMPKGKKPLADSEIELITKWIAEGATDDTPDSAKVRYDMQHPPVYTLPPVVTSLDYSPDGKLLAVAGFHEVLLHKADGSGLEARLVGMSARLESIRFSPDGKSLAVTGGLPGRMGEVQVWDVAKRKLRLSVAVTYDTIYGANWSPDGKLISLGCSDKSVRVIEAESGKEVLFQGSHNDWVLDTVFSAKGTHLVSVGRDRTAKLTVVKTQRFVDNITSITPGALKGGIAAVERHPTKDELLVGGADGVPKLFRMFRTSKRVIGDNANLIRKFPALKGRIFDVAISADGQRIVAGSSYNGTGEVRVYAYDINTGVPKDLVAIMEKRSNTRTPAEKKKLDKFRTKGVKLVAETNIDKSGIYAVAFRPDGKFVAAAGSDGIVRLIDAEKGTVAKEFAPVPLQNQAAIAKRSVPQVSFKTATTAKKETLHKNDKLVGIEVQPAAIKIGKRFDTIQLIVIGRLQFGDVIDVTRMVTITGAENVVEVSAAGLVRPKAAGRGTLTCSLAGQLAKLPVDVSGFDDDYIVNYVRDVMPAVSKLGCNAGTCHGSKDGKNGFKLSLRGYDPIYDTRAFTDDLAARRVNIASPDDSLMLLKATGAVPHVGSQLTRPGESGYEIIRNWIANGAKLDLETPRVKSIEIFPKNPVVQRVNSNQQMRVLATYANGEVRDVTPLAFIESGNGDIAETNATSLVTVLRRGEAPILARFEGAYTATTLTVMGDRSGFVWKQPPTNNFVDELVAKKLERVKTLPSDICTDAEFIRRVYLDLIGLPPTVDALLKFLADKRDTRVKRDELIDQLVGSDDYIEHWTNKWADLLQVNRKFLGTEGAKAFRAWIRNELAQNTPYDDFVRKILTASGSNLANPAASYYKILRTPQETMENTTHLFLAVRFNCNKCHDHPFERWTQDQYYQTAAFFAQFGLKKDPKSGKTEIGRTAVEKGKPLYEIVFDTTQGEVKHDRTGQITPPEFPYAVKFDVPENATRRQQLANWITSTDNQYFAKSYVNRMWGYLFGVGIIEPIDDIRAGNPPTNPELLNRLTAQFLENKFNVRDLVRTICKSRTYQVSIASNEWNEDDKINYSHALARRLPAEVLYDALHRVTGSISKIPGVPPGTRAAQLPDAGAKLPSGFLANLGRPPRESACECERTTGLELGPVIALVSGPTINNAISDPANEIAKLVASQKDNGKLVNEMFLRILNRHATADEIAAGVDLIHEIPVLHKQLVAELAAYEQELAPTTLAKEKQRLVDIAKAKVDLAAYEKELAPRLAVMEKERKAKTERLMAELKKYETRLPKQLAAWEERQKQATVWTTLDPSKMTATGGTKLAKEKDLSIFVSGRKVKTIYKVTAETSLPNITGIRLEVLADKRLPKQGPGRAPDGNFVLSEFELKAAPKATPANITKVKLQNGQADFSQVNYDVKTAIDGKAPAANNGWAVAPKFGVNHVAVFEAKTPFGDASGTVLNFELNQQFSSNQHSIGRFRLSITNSPQPILLNGPPEPIAELLAVPADKRDDKQKAELLKYYRGIDPGLKQRQAAIAESKQPLPIDPKLKQLQETLAYRNEALPIDPKLRQLRNDVELSKKQLASPRLTAAQDITWALINSPSFLFNR